MQVRPLRASDLPALRAMHAASGFAYEFPGFEQMEAMAVVADENDQPVMAAFAERILQLYLLCDANGHPAAKLHGIRLLHQAMGAELRAKGYSEANAFLPPEVERTFGRRLMKSFGWLKNWASYCIRF